MLIQKQYNELILLEIYIEMKVQQCFSLFAEAKETILDFSKGPMEVLLIYFVLI